MTGLQHVWSYVFKQEPFFLYKAVPKRSKRTICGPNTGLPTNDEFKGKTCAEQIKALHDRDTHPVSHVIFDLDGVVLDSNIYSTLAHEEYLMKWKKALKTEIKYRVMGMRNVEAGKVLTNEYFMPFNEHVYAHGVWQIQRQLFHKTKLTKGIDDLVCYFLGQKMPLALISSANGKAFKIFMSKLKGFERNFCHIVHGDDVLNGKPDPEILIKAARQFQGGPGDMKNYLLIDGSYSGTLAAKAAGMQSILVTDPGMPNKMQQKATVVLNDLKYFDPTAFHLPEVKKQHRR